MLRDLLPDRFSRHWQDILKLLSILIDRWPAILEEQGVIDAADRRNRLVVCVVRSGAHTNLR